MYTDDAPGTFHVLFNFYHKPMRQYSFDTTFYG